MIDRHDIDCLPANAVSDLVPVTDSKGANAEVAMGLRARCLIYTAVVFLVATLTTWFAIRYITRGLVEDLGIRFAEKQVLYDKSRTLQPLVREIALARQMADSPLLRSWSKQEDDAALRERALAELEGYRIHFRDKSFFFAVVKSGNYYFNDADNQYAGKQFRYKLNPATEQDKWFFATVAENLDYQVNVDRNFHLNTTKVWINVLLRDGNKVMAVVGTGLDLSSYIHDVVDIKQPGISSLFVDRGAAIQVYQDTRLINFSNLTKEKSERKTMDLLLDGQTDRVQLRALLSELGEGKKNVGTLFVHVGGKRYLLGATFLPEINWFELTLMDVDALIQTSEFAVFGISFAIALLAALALTTSGINHLVLNPIAKLDQAARQMEKGDYSPIILSDSSDEIGRLATNFQRMANAIRETTESLESKVAERTDALMRLTQTDAMTELLNRRGMTERLAAEIDRSRRYNVRLGLMIIDIDYFKQINDGYGHEVGDRVLTAVANCINTNGRSYDYAARWGGDEFLLLLPHCTIESLRGIGERIRSAVLELNASLGVDDLQVTVSVGGYLAHVDEDQLTIFERADKALYQAKASGRNCVCISELSSDEGEKRTPGK